MELGITPIITSGMVFQLLAGTNMLDIDMNLKTDRELYQTAQKRKLLPRVVESKLTGSSACNHHVLWPSLRLRLFRALRASI
jgi:hypothetical protein